MALKYALRMSTKDNRSRLWPLRLLEANLEKRSFFASSGGVDAAKASTLPSRLISQDTRRARQSGDSESPLLHITHRQFTRTWSGTLIMSSMVLSCHTFGLKSFSSSSMAALMSGLGRSSPVYSS